MPLISLDIQESMADRLKIAASHHKSSISTFIISIITEKLNEADDVERKKHYALAKTQGSFIDDPLSKPPDIPWVADVPRRFEIK
ncbi:MAG: hypothetical protein FWG02_06965 [Holophagaceae bacterium]|nr:hypothetical protein [Holophagaceae bacterium]